MADAVPNATRRRRGPKRRSPSGGRRRAPTPEPPRDGLPGDEDDDDDKPRSVSTPPDDRDTTVEALMKIETIRNGGDKTEIVVTETKRVFKIERVDDTPDLAEVCPTPEAKPMLAKVEVPLSVSNISKEKEGAAQITTSDAKTVDLKPSDDTLVKPALAEKPEEIPKIVVKSTKEKERTAKSTEGVKPKEAVWGPFFRETWQQWKLFKRTHSMEYAKIIRQRNRCICDFILMTIYCGCGGLIFRFTEGALEAFYKCGVKRVKRNFIDDLWVGSHHLREEDWKSQARRKLMELENQLHEAHEAGVTSYSGQRSWSFLNAVVYAVTIVTTIGYGHISPSTTPGRAITIVYAIFGIPLFLILLADFGKLFTRCIKFVWAFVRRVYYTGSCRKVRRTAPVQEVWKGVQLVYDYATFRRPSQIPPEGEALQQPQPQPQPQVMPLDGYEPGTPAPSAFEVDDEFNLPISIAIFILLAYIFVGAAVYFVWEEWTFFESFYFVFISMSTIGFGDFVPQHPMYMMASIIYLVFGLALTSMCINVVQEKLSDHFRQASAKIGATIGLRVAEEAEGTGTPMQPMEVTEIQSNPQNITKSAST